METVLTLSPREVPVNDYFWSKCGGRGSQALFLEVMA